MTTRITRRALGAGMAVAALARPALAQGQAFRIGLILPMTGPFASTGRQVDAGDAAPICASNGDSFAGRRVEVLLRDDTGVAPDVTRRLAQELVVRERVKVLAGFGLTPLALAAAPIATEAKVPMIVMAAATSIIPSRSPFILRTSFTLPQACGPMAEWACAQRHPERGDAGDRLRAGPRCREGVQGPLRCRRRQRARSSCARRCATRTTRPSSSACAMRGRMRCSSSSPPARARR